MTASTIPKSGRITSFWGNLGGSQTDIADLNAEDIDWKERTVPYQRRKTGVPVIITFGADAASVLESLPKFGPLFPSMARIKENHRAKMFIKRLKTVGITSLAQLPLRLGRAGQDGRDARTMIRAAGA